MGGLVSRPGGLLRRRGGPREDGRAGGITGLLAGLSQLIPAARGHAPGGPSRGVIGPHVSGRGLLQAEASQGAVVGAKGALLVLQRLEGVLQRLGDGLVELGGEGLELSGGVATAGLPAHRDGRRPGARGALRDPARQRGEPGQQEGGGLGRGLAEPALFK
eukprot:4608338-Lingulodinium_polyedra.AAC.1